MKLNKKAIGMWIFYSHSYEANLEKIFGYSKDVSKKITKNAKKKYKEILLDLPEFEPDDHFKLNIISCALLIAFILSMPSRPNLEDLTLFYKNGTMTSLTKFFCKLAALQKFSTKDIENMKKSAKFKAGNRNPYSWNMDFREYEDGSGYEALFTQCGICTLMKKYSLFDLTPAMCAFDYTMSEAGGKTKFIREYTLATNGPYCDCGYKKK